MNFTHLFALFPKAIEILHFHFNQTEIYAVLLLAKLVPIDAILAEVEFVHAVSAGGSVKFLPAV